MPDSPVSRTEPSPSRIAFDRCPGCHHLGGMGITRQNRYWHPHCWIVHLERAIVEHRTAIANAGSVKVQSGYEPVAEAKHRTDERLWEAIRNA